MWKVLPLLALLCSTAHGQDNPLYPASKAQPSAAIVIEFAPVPVAPPPWTALSAKPIFLTIKSDLTLWLGNDPVAREALVSMLEGVTEGDKNRFFSE